MPQALVIREVSRPVRLSGQVVDALRGGIESGELAPGARLPTEQILGERFGVSRAVVREAIAHLKSDGYVETRQGAGAFVAARPGLASFRIGHEGKVDAGDLGQIFELRAAATSTARLAAERRTRGELATMRAALDSMARAIGDGTDGAAADDAFHRAIATATHNGYMQRFVEFLGHHFSESRRPSWTDAGRRAGRPQAAQREHERIHAAIERRDAAAAARAAEDHLRGSAARLGAGPAARRTPKGGRKT